MTRANSYQIWCVGKLWFSFPSLEEAQKKVEELERVLILSFEIRDVRFDQLLPGDVNYWLAVSGSASRHRRLVIQKFEG